MSYVVREPSGNHCVIIDSVLDYDPKSGRTQTDSADEIVAYVKEHNLEVDWLLETHAHADHLSAAPYIKEILGGKTAIGECIQDVHTPGHTPACMTYVAGDAAFIGDTLFMPDYGTARADFPGGDARQLYRSIQKLFALPDDTRLFLCHDYKGTGTGGISLGNHGSGR